jgi:hypothetical protein
VAKRRPFNIEHTCSAVARHGKSGMKSIPLNAGKGARGSVSAQWIGKDLIVYLFNGQGHLAPSP